MTTKVVPALQGSKLTLEAVGSRRRANHQVMQLGSHCTVAIASDSAQTRSNVFKYEYTEHVQSTSCASQAEQDSNESHCLCLVPHNCSTLTTTASPLGMI